MVYRFTRCIAIALAGLCLARPVIAADYPSRPITFFTMVQPGAQIDRLARGLAERFAGELGQPVNVRNITGGSHGSVMATELGKAGNDGYTLAIAATTAYTYQPHHAPVQYSLDDFEFLSLVALNSSGFVSAPDKPWDTLSGAFEWARENGKALVCMFHGSDDRDVIQRIAKSEDVNISLIPSKGGPSIIQAVTGGHADIGYLGAILYEHVRAGRLKLIASALNERLSPIPDVPTLKEQGYDESVEMFITLVGPAGIPDDVVARLDTVVNKLAGDDATEQFITEQLLMRPVKWGREHAHSYVQSTYELFGKQAKASD